LCPNLRGLGSSPDLRGLGLCSDRSGLGQCPDPSELGFGSGRVQIQGGWGLGLSVSEPKRGWDGGRTQWGWVSVRIQEG
jgi:hypothetical protein